LWGDGMGYLDNAGLSHLWGKVNTTLSTKQDKLTGLPGQVVGFDVYEGATAVQGWSNPNLLDNWYFVDSINQRGQTEYTAAGYTIDRWKFLTPNASIRLTSSGLHVIAENSADLIFDQAQEDEWLYGKTVTISVLVSDYVKGMLAIQSGGLLEATQKSGLVYVAGTYTKGLPYTFRMFNSGDSEFTIKAVKLELGFKQTLAHQDESGKWVLNDPPPDKALELAKCQRYYQVFTDAALRPAKAADFRPPMRINPALGTINIGGTICYTADANL